MRVDVFRRILLARSHVVDVTPLLHEHEAREMRKTEVATTDVGLHE